MRFASIALLMAAASAQTPGTLPQTVLTGLAIMPAETFAPGPPAGAFMQDGVRAPEPPFPSQPVQGFSAISPDADGWFWALSDNGFGSKRNSPDYLLRIYRVRPLFDEKRVEVGDHFIQLSDPDRRVPFHIVNENIADRLLTGADFDPESMVRLADGTFWIGDEFGPFLLHVDAGGRVLGAPIDAPGIRSPDNPFLPPPNAGEQSQATVGRSRGFEGLAWYAARGTLIALLEGGTLSDAGKETRALEFDPATRTFTGRMWRVPFDKQGHSFTELVPLVADRDASPARSSGEYLRYFGGPGVAFLTIERDDGHGPAARFKKVFIVAFSHDERVTLATKGGVLPGDGPSTPMDLLRIEDPNRIGTSAGPFTFPFVTTEAIWPLWPDVILVNDNNYPATGGRVAGQRDHTEFIQVRVRRR